MRLKQIEKMDCPFCPMFESSDATYLCITPLNPVVEGHKIYIPREHVRDFSDEPDVYGRLSEIVAENTFSNDFNIITSRGSDATQTVAHLHIHVVPRSANDGLHLPWTDQEKQS